MPRIAHICLGPVVAMVSVVAQAQVTWRTDSLMGTWAVEQRLAELGPTLGRGVVRAVDTEHLYEDLKKEVSTMPVFADIVQRPLFAPERFQVAIARRLESVKRRPDRPDG